MKKFRLCTSDLRFMDLVWDNEPIPSGELVKKSQEKLGWKKSTTYTMLKKLSEKGMLKNDNSIVSSLVSRETVQVYESEYVIDNAFSGSLPAFIAAFVSNKRLSDNDIKEIKRLMDENNGGD